jgi:alkyl sulfatase BDS1-like metallo-beta-lactamase superfamily hydrolase
MLGAPKEAHATTLLAHARNIAGLDFSDTRDFDDTRRGFIGTIADAQFPAKAGGLAWTMQVMIFSTDLPPIP